MRITALRAEELTGSLDLDLDTFWEERLVMPLDIYEEFREIPVGSELAGYPDVVPHEVDGEVRVSQVFLTVETDEGVSGTVGPLDRTWARLALELEPLLLGRDPLATEKLWDLMYRQRAHGRKGKGMQAISAIDCALWDLKGRYFDEPVYRLLGGPTRESLPAYVSTLGYSVEPDRVRERVRHFKEAGYDGQKWFPRYGPGAGETGKAKNEALVAAAREAAGDGYDLMFDVWMAWDLPYALEMTRRMEPYDPRWIEEPLPADRMDGHAKLRESTTVPVAAGEREYTRWGFYELFQRDAIDVAQPDTMWGGGITETAKICSLGDVFDVPVIPHGYSVPVNVQLSAAQPPTVTPTVEYLVKWNVGLQFFFENPVEPAGGEFAVPTESGLGVRIDESLIEDRSPITID